MAARGGIYRRSQPTQDDDSDDDQDDEPGRVYEMFEKYVKPLFGKDKKWFWWNIGFFGTACLITRTHGLYQFEWMKDYLTKESPLDKAMQTQIPGQMQSRM